MLIMTALATPALLSHGVEQEIVHLIVRYKIPFSEFYDCLLDAVEPGLNAPSLVNASANSSTFVRDARTAF